MNYTTEDAIQLAKTLQADLEQHGPDAVFTTVKQMDPELLALTLVLTTLSR